MHNAYAAVDQKSQQPPKFRGRTVHQYSVRNHQRKVALCKARNARKLALRLCFSFAGRKDTAIQQQDLIYRQLGSKRYRRA